MKALLGSPLGRCVPISGYDNRFQEPYDTYAYLPDDLPASIDLDNEAWRLVGDAMAELGRLDAAASVIQNPALLTRIEMRREAIGTSALEGTYANLTDLLAAEELIPERTGRETDLPPNVREVLNYTRAASHAYEWVAERPITVGMISALQRIIVQGTDSDGPHAGDVRTEQVYIGSKQRRMVEARFIPAPPGDQLRQRYEAWTDWLTDEQVVNGLQLVVRMAMAHYQFETIHPYPDGNGRLGRLIAVLQLLREGQLRSPVLSISPWLKDRGPEYRDHLLAVSRTGDWAPWVGFFAQAVAAQSRDGHDRIMRLLKLRSEMGDEVRSKLPKARLAVEIAVDLIAYPMLTVAAAQQRYGRTNEANRNAISKLVDIGVLEPYSDQRYDRLFWSPRVYHVINSD